MYSAGKSDCCVVPEKVPNKGDPFRGEPAEEPEGRRQIEENAMKEHTDRTQDRTTITVSKGLQGVREAAQRDKGLRFTTLLHHVNGKLLLDSFYLLKRQAAPGVDQVTWGEYEEGVEARISGLHDRIHRGAYRAQPSRRVYIPKLDGRQRPLGIAALEDKIVQQAVARVLNQI